jgi:mono/diheme cytochrome c family protein
MKRILRWLRIGLLSLVLLLVLAGGVVYLLSERLLRRTYTEPRVDIAVPRDSASITEGHRLALIRGCATCHGADVEGSVFIDDLLLARLVAPDLTVAVRKYDNPDLVRIVRRGVLPDGSSVIAMPSEMFSRLTDGDLARIIAYLRSVPPHSGLAPERRLGPLARIGFVAGRFRPAAELVRRAGLVTGWPRKGDATAPGAYLARTSCTECHGLDLRGGDQAPDLRIARAYSFEAFTELMRQGAALGNRELPLMSQVARRRFHYFTDPELRALYSYLIARAAPDSQSSGE